MGGLRTCETAAATYAGEPTDQAYQDSLGPYASDDGEFGRMLESGMLILLPLPAEEPRVEIAEVCVSDDPIFSAAKLDI